jgi:hypothetical protein
MFINCQLLSKDLNALGAYPTGAMNFNFAVDNYVPYF